jgi:hypothetical protein
MIQTLLTIVFAAEDEIAGLAILLFIAPIALLFYLILPNIALYIITKKYKSKYRFISFLSYFGLLSLLIIVLFNLPTNLGGIQLELFRGSLYLLLSVPLTYPIGVWIIGLVSRRRNHNTALQN